MKSGSAVRAVGAEAHLYIDRTIGGRLGEDVCHTSDEELRVIVERPVDSECLVGSIDRLQTARSCGHRVHHVARPGMPGVWLSTLLTGDNPLQAREDLLMKVQVGLRQGRHNWRCGHVDEWLERGWRLLYALSDLLVHLVPMSAGRGT